MRRPIHDHSGHVVVLVDADSGEIVENYRYTAFGEAQILALNEAVTENPWCFASKRLDPESGLINFGRRYFDPLVGRWITPGPRGYEDGANLQAYVHNSPLTHIDLYGLYAARCANCGRPLSYQGRGSWDSSWTRSASIC